MRRCLPTLLLLLLSTVPSCKSAEPVAQPHLTAAKADDAKADESRSRNKGDRRMAGGWRNRKATDESITDAATVAVKELRKALKDRDLTLVSIRSAKSQVVAGANYRLVLDVKGKDGPRTVEATIYRPPGMAASRMTSHRVR